MVFWDNENEKKDRERQREREKNRVMFLPANHSEQKTSRCEVKMQRFVNTIETHGKTFTPKLLLNKEGKLFSKLSFAVYAPL